MTYTIAWTWVGKSGPPSIAHKATAKEALALVEDHERSDAIIEYVDTPEYGRLDPLGFKVLFDRQ
jgi:hypothetical protein